MESFSAQCRELQTFVDTWCKQQETALHNTLFVDHPYVEESRHSHDDRFSLTGPLTRSVSGSSLVNDGHQQTDTIDSSDVRITLQSLERRSASQALQMHRETILSQLSPHAVRTSRHQRCSLPYMSSDVVLSNEVKRELSRDGSGVTRRERHKSCISPNLPAVHNQSERLSGVRVALATFVQGGSFESIIALAIIFNAALMSVQANYDMQNPSSPSNQDIQHIELVLHIIYAAELALRLFVHGRQYFVGVNWKWNWFDMFLVAMSIYDHIVTAVDELQKTSSYNLSFFRMLRLLKMLKLLRVIRLMKFFKELRLILYAVMGGVQAMFWACVLIATISYVAGILFVQACAQYIKEVGDDIPAETQTLIQQWWRDVQTAMLSLFTASTSGKEWTQIASPLGDAGPIWYGIFVMYIAFFDFVIMNTLTSLFVDTVMDHSLSDLEMGIQLELEKKTEYINMLRAFFETMDKDNDGVITVEEFENHIGNPCIQAFAATLDIDIRNAKAFFRHLSNDGTIQVDVEAFVVACIKLKGNARSVDLIEHIHAFKKHVIDTARFVDDTALRLQSLESLIQKMYKQTAAAPLLPPSFLQQREARLCL